MKARSGPSAGPKKVSDIHFVCVVLRSNIFCARSCGVIIIVLALLVVLHSCSSFLSHVHADANIRGSSLSAVDGDASNDYWFITSSFLQVI